MSSSDRVRTDGHDVTPVVPCTSGGQPEKTYPCEQEVGGWFFASARGLQTAAKPRSLLAKIHERCWRFSVIARDALARRAPSEQRKNSQTRPLRTGKEQGLRREKGGSKSASEPV